MLQCDVVYVFYMTMTRNIRHAHQWKQDKELIDCIAMCYIQHEVCVTSNLATLIFGVRVTLNKNNPKHLCAVVDIQDGENQRIEVT